MSGDFTITSAVSLLKTLKIRIHGIMGTGRSEAWLCGHSFAGFVGSISAGDVDMCLLWLFHVVSSSG